MNYLIPVFILLFLGIMVYFLTKSSKKQIEWLNSFAQENQYKVETQSKDFVYEITSQSPQPKWKMRAYSRSATTLDTYMHASREYTEWIMEGNFSYGEAYIIPRDASWKVMSDEKILSFLKPVWSKMGIPVDDFTAYLLPDEEITASYMIFCNEQLSIKKLFTAPFLEELKGWNSLSRKKIRISIRTTSNKIELQVGDVINDRELAKKLIQLGLVIAESK